MTQQEKEAIRVRINDMETRLDDTVSGLTSGPVRDAMKLVVPMMKDQLQIVRDLVNLSD